MSAGSSSEREGWRPGSWRSRPAAQAVRYGDEAALKAMVRKLRSLPPLVTSFEIERLKAHLAEAQEGRRFLLQGGDCAETFDDCQPEVITSKLKILLQMSMVLILSIKKPVLRVGRFAGQYAKPRSRPTELRIGADGKARELPSYFGDLINRHAFEEEARRADPALLLEAYQHAAMTLNFIRSLSVSGFADLHHPEYWDLSFLSEARLSEGLREEYKRSTEDLADAIRFMEVFGESSVEELTRAFFYTSHEALHLPYEAAQTRTVPRREGHYLLTTHLPWIGDRTRQLEGAHVELLRGVKNPVGLKCGPTLDPEELVSLVARLNPKDEPGKVVLITRLGAGRVRDHLPAMIEAVERSGRRVLWVSDPMHGNTRMSHEGFKTRLFGDILREVEEVIAVHRERGSVFGGVHFELTGEDVTECVGAGVREEDLGLCYATACDPRLNYRQALEMAFAIGKRLKE